MPKQAVAYTITPRLPGSLPSQARRLVEKAIQAHLDAQEGLIAFLDAVDGDPDLEPSLGSPMGCGGDITNQDQHWNLGISDDRECDAGDECECDEDYELADVALNP